MITMEQLQYVVGAVVSALFMYLPFLANWYYQHAEDRRKYIMAGVVMAVSLLIFGVNCLEWQLPDVIQAPGMYCTAEGIVDYIGIVIKVLIGNQVIYQILPKSDANKQRIK
jgi:hypothetical protein